MSLKLEAIFLGTGGGVPARRRYLPAVALRRGGDWWLFDAGEGVQMRLRESPLGWGGLQGIFISHLHGDHVMGLPGLLMSLGMARIEQPVQIWGPPGLEDLVSVMLRVCHVQLPFPIEIHALPRSAGRLLQGPDTAIDAFLLRHRMPCYGFRWQEAPRPGRFLVDRARALEIPPGPLYKRLQEGESITLEDGRVVRSQEVMGPPRPGRRVAYCTDTAPTRAVIENARGADLLIHDATFDASLEAEARISGHSTAAQAAEQARAARCLRLALTHISARYDDDRVLLADATPIFPESFVARDLMVVEIPAREAGDPREE